MSMQDIAAFARGFFRGATDRRVDDLSRRRIEGAETALHRERARRLKLVHDLKLVDGLLSSGKPSVAQSQLRAILIREG